MEFKDGVRLHAIGGEQVLICQVNYAPGKQVPWHTHEDTEQVMFILEGEVEMTIEDETKTLKAGDVVVVNRGLNHKLFSESGVTFMEALAPVPLDHVPDQSSTSCSARTAAPARGEVSLRCRSCGWSCSSAG